MPDKEQVTKKDVLSALLNKVTGDSALAKVLIPIIKDTARDFLNKVSGEILKHLFQKKANEAAKPPAASGGKPSLEKLLNNPKVRKAIEEVIGDGGVQ